MTTIKGEEALNGFFWNGINSFVGGGSLVVATILLARILDPADFGLIAIVTAIVVILESVIDGGFSAALIQKLNPTDQDYQTVFLLNTMSALALVLLINAFAHSIVLFFGQTELLKILRILSITPIITATIMVQRTKAIKSLQFKTLAKFTILSNIIAGIVSLIMAYNGQGVWSLVCLTILSRIIESFLFFVQIRWRPTFRFSSKSFKELFSFGSNLLISSILNSIFSNIYKLVIGKLYNPVLLGFYTQADNLKSYSTIRLMGIVDKVSYPLLSKIQNDDTKLIEVTKKLLRTSSFISCCLSVGIIVSSENIIINLLGVKWITVAHYLKIIMIGGIFTPFQLLNLKILLVKKRSELFLKIEIIKKILIVINVLIGMRLGIIALLWGSSMISLLSFFINSYYVNKLIGYGIKEQLSDTKYSFFAGGIIGMVVWLISWLDHSLVKVFLIQIGASILVFFLLLEIFKASEYILIKKYLRNFLGI